MKKIYTLISLLSLCWMSVSAITVSVIGGGPVADGETITVSRDQFVHQYIPGIMDKWIGKVDIKVEGAAPIAVSLRGTSGDIQFCPIGQNCYTWSSLLPGVFTAKGELSNNVNEIPVDMNYFELGDNLPEETQTMTATFTDATSTFSLTVLFDTNVDSGVESVWAAEGKVTAYSISGVRVLDNADPEAMKSLPAGLYIVNGKKTVIK